MLQHTISNTAGVRPGVVGDEELPRDGEADDPVGDDAGNGDRVRWNEAADDGGRPGSTVGTL